MRFVPDRSGFEELARRGRLTFVYKEVVADSDTPVSAYAKLGRGPYSFLLESVVGGNKWAAYSFVGVRPRAVVRARGEDVEILTADPRSNDFVVSERVKAKEPVRFLDEYLAKLQPAVPPGLPRFFGGAVGFLTYDIVRSFERLPSTKPDDLGLPELCFAITDTVVIFDNLRGTLKVVSAVEVGDGPGVDLDRLYADACRRIDGVLDRLAKPTPPMRALDPVPPSPVPVPKSTITQEAFEAGVRRIKEYILAGDAFQVVYSQRFEIPRGDIDPFDVYRALRATNPSPYMFHLEYPDAVVTGASPEVLVRMEGGYVEVRPIAGTARRGATPEEDVRLESEMRNDPKEVAEHVMLIDLGRNDVGRVSAPGTVRVTETMVTERYSHVMHLVSNVRGQVAPGVRPADVLRAAFPAGTLSGAPKIRAMEIIEEAEPFRRNLYGGAVGYIGYTGNLDTAIAIRTLVTKGDTIYVQAGAGLVADSKPEAEYAECHNKARAVCAAVEIARNAGAAPKSGGKN
ncbi:MAG TPA: anthranilate synthase component I [Polyangia bacterium]|jgi:anthranilate synthase component 1|nr:anthranilate synthase component I [Polyangia bacterium]